MRWLIVGFGWIAAVPSELCNRTLLSPTKQPQLIRHLRKMLLCFGGNSPHREGGSIAFCLANRIADARPDRAVLISLQVTTVQVFQPVSVSSRIGIEVKSGQLLSGQVLWTRGFDIGIGFDDPIDVANSLKTAWNGAAGKQPPLPRMKHRHVHYSRI